MPSRTCATGSVIVALALCGCATTNTPPPKTANTVSPPCLTSTGSRIPASPGAPCVAFGRSYSQTDIEETGKTTAGGALGYLDPSVTITH